MNSDCIFCNKNENIIYRTKNFYVKVGIGIVTAGHVMIITKDHYSCIASIGKNLINEYLELKKYLIQKITDTFSKPFMQECGVFDQTVKHAHIHFIPSSSKEYDTVDPYQKIIPVQLKYLNTKLIEIKDFHHLQKCFNETKLYTYYEYDNKKSIVYINDTMLKYQHGPFGYRYYFSSIGKGVRSWSKMTEEDRKKDQIRIQETIDKLKL